GGPDAIRASLSASAALGLSDPLGLGSGLKSNEAGVGMTGDRPGGDSFFPGSSPFRARRASGATRDQWVERAGGNKESEAAVAAGLKWFAAHQGPDGRWSLDIFHQHGRCNCTGFGINNDIAGTSFGLLPFLGAGFTHKPGQQNPYAKHVENGLKFLMSRQNREGDCGGGMYGHGLAAIALCEAFGVSADPRLKSSAQRALNFIVNAQNQRGGWDYSPRGNRNDTSVGGWQLMALKSGPMAGLDVPARTL